MYNIVELKRALPFEVDNMEVDLLNYRDINWYIDVIQQKFFNEFIDNKFDKVAPEDMRFRLTNLVIAYRLDMKIQGEARLIIKDKSTGERIGGCTLFETGGDKIEVGYWVLPAYQGKGNAKKLIYNINKLIFKLSKINRIDLVIRSDNIKSIMIANKCGYKEVLRFKGKYKENVVYELERGKNE